MQEKKIPSFKKPLDAQDQKRLANDIKHNYHTSSYITKGDKGLAIGLVSNLNFIVTFMSDRLKVTARVKMMTFLPEAERRRKRLQKLQNVMVIKVACP